VTVTVGNFRTDYPEFADTTKYPDSAVQYWLTVAMQMIPAQLWAGMYDTGIELFIAHNLVVEQRAAAGGGSGGMGIVSSKSVGRASVSYDTSLGLEQDAGVWNTTLYGTRMYRLIRMFGAGGLQL
jgi:hypothetical protein